MIYRCTARFMQAFDALDRQAQALVLSALRGFEEAPRAPSPYSRVVQPEEPHETWAMPCGSNLYVTYSFHNDPQQEDHFVCVLRNVGQSE